MRENRSRREAERQRQQREKEGQRVAREEAKRRDQGEVTRKRQEAQRQEKMVQQEMVRLRRQMEERRNLERLVRQRYGIHSNHSPVLKWAPVFEMTLRSDCSLCVLSVWWIEWIDDNLLKSQLGMLPGPNNYCRSVLVEKWRIVQHDETTM